MDAKQRRTADEHGFTQIGAATRGALPRLRGRGVATVKAVFRGADVQILTPILPRLQRRTFFCAYLGLADSA
jgi:hypothetical protein